MRTKEEIDLLNILHKEVEDARGETGTPLWAADARDGALVRGLYLNDVMERRRRANEEKRGWGWHWPYGDCAPPKPLCRLMIFFFAQYPERVRSEYETRIADLESRLLDGN